MKPYQGFSLVKRMRGVTLTAALAALLASSAAMAQTHYTSTINGTNPYRILQGGDTVAVTGNWASALYAADPGSGIEVIGGGITATSAYNTVQIADRAYLDLGTGSLLKASQAASTNALVVGGGPGNPKDTVIGRDLSVEVTSGSTAAGITGSNSALINLTGNTSVKTHSGAEGIGLYALDNGGMLIVEDAVIEMEGAIQRAIYARDTGTITATGKVSLTATGSVVYGAYVGSAGATITLNDFTTDLIGTSSTYGASMYWGTLSMLGSSDLSVSSATNAYGLYTNDRCTVSIGTQGSTTPNNSVWNITGDSANSGSGIGAAIRTELYRATTAGLHDIKVHNTTLNSSHYGIVVGGSQTHIVFDNSTLLVDPADGDLAYVAAKTVSNISYGSDLLIDARNASQLSGTVAVDATSQLRVSLASDAQWTLADNTTITDLKLDNGGRLAFPVPTTASDFKTLTVLENYDATNGGGTIVMNAKLDDGANPATDLLVIEGDTSGTAALDIQNFNGVGALTVGDGIQVVQVNGNSDAVFTLANPVIADTFEYELVKVGNHWYLQSSQGNPPDPTPTIAVPSLTSAGLVLLIGLLGALAFTARRRFY
jgi:autotransporter family porin